MREIRRTFTVNQASPSAGMAPSRGRLSPTFSPAGAVFIVLIMVEVVPIGCGPEREYLLILCRLLSVQTKEDEGESFRVPGIRGRRSGAAEDVYQRTQSLVLPQ